MRAPFIGGSGQVNLSLRGLGPQRNLVLLDGRRLLPSNSDGTVDINQLPAGIVGNVEIITGGASAVYGSDAVSGVVNFKTKRPAGRAGRLPAPMAPPKPMAAASST